MGLPTDQPAARITDIDTGHPPSSPTPIISGSSNVLTNNLPAARHGDLLVPHHPGIREISEGSSSVLINNKPAARVSDAINCGGLIVTGSADVLIGDSPSLVTADRIQRLNIQFPSEKGSKKSTKTAPQAKTSASNSSGSSSPASQSTSSPASATSSAGNAQSPSSTRSLTPAIPEDPPEEVTIWLAAPSTKEAGNWSDGYIQSILEIATEIDAETEITAAEADIAIVEYSNELPDMFQPMFKPAEDLDKTPAKVTISLIDGITPNGVKPFTEADLLEAAVTFEEMAPLIDAAINGDPLAIAELSPAVVTRKPITVEQLASLNEEQPKPVAPTPIERLNIEFPNRRKSNRRSAVEMPPLTERQSATVDEIHASLVSSGIKGVGKPEVAEYVTKREALTKQATLLESGTWYRGKAHDLADKNREVARLDYEFARRSDQVGLETSTPVLNVLGLGGVTKAATTQAVGKVAKSVTAKRSAVPKKIPLIKTESGGTLIFHENLDGHTIRRHVGKSDQRLLKRFDSEPDILGSSTYPDIETAQRVVGNVLSKNQAKVREWLSNSAKRRLTLNETLDYEVGRVIPQGAKTSQPSNKSFVLLIKDPIAPKGYRVHTSFPKPNN